MHYACTIIKHKRSFFKHNPRGENSGPCGPKIFAGTHESFLLVRVSQSAKSIFTDPGIFNHIMPPKLKTLTDFFQPKELPQPAVLARERVVTREKGKGNQSRGKEM